MKNYFSTAALLTGALLLSSCDKQAVEPQLSAAQSSAAHLQNRNFSAHLTGDEEVPTPVVTKATGQASFKLSKDGLSLSYKLIVANIQTVRFGHLHLGNRGFNGPVVVDLVGRTAPSPQGVIAEGVLTSASIKPNTLGINTLADLVTAMENGGVYVNVHSDQNPGGELRGQVR